MSEFKQIAPATFEIKKEGSMRVPGLLIATKKLMEEIDIEKPLEQLKRVAELPGIVGHSIAMPDIHWGYGFPIGGVAAMAAEEGVISPGGVGYDINCGVRLAIAPIMADQLSEQQREALIQKIYSLVPSGIGIGQKRSDALSESDYNAIIRCGARWSIEQGRGFTNDLAHCESNGFIAGADMDAVSAEAKERGRLQLGTIGSGNHFVEIGTVDELLIPAIANSWGLDKGQLYILIHSGSRGFGHQICQETLDNFLQAGYGDGLSDKQLVAAPISSSAGKRYFQGMAAAANYAFNNRQLILHEVRRAFKEVLAIPPEEIRLIYDVCHNIAKFEEHLVDGVMQRLCIHRKGATRAFGPGNSELAATYSKSGQPVLVPGDMGRASYIMAGCGNPLAWSSSCHGAGRARSRVKSLKSWCGCDTVAHMKKQGVIVMANSPRTIAEEMPDAYKNVDDVVVAVEEAGLAKRVARLKPMLVVKG